MPAASTVQPWRSRLTTIGLAAFILLGCLAIRLLSPDETAQAQTERVTQTSASETIRRPSRPEIVAVVNGNKITRSELARECIRRYGVKVLESEVNKRLILEACKQSNVRITAADVEAEIERMASKFALSSDRWLAMLQDERDISPTQYRRDIVWPTLALRRLAVESLKVTKEELREAYESEYGPMVQARLIATKSRTKADQLRERAAEALQEFDNLAKDYSEDENSAAARGLIPPIRKHVGEPAVVEAAFALEEGQVSDVIQAAGQYLILKCERRLPARELGAEQQKQVITELKDTIADRKLRSVGSEIFQQLQDQAEIVNVLNDPSQQEKLPGVAATVNGEAVTLEHLGEQCILRHGKEILDIEINRMLLEEALQRRSLKVQQDELQAEIRRAAESYGFLLKDGSPDVNAWLDHITSKSDSSVDTYVRDAVWPTVALKKLVRSTVKVTEEDLKKGFLANYGERVDVLAIVLSNQRTAHEVFELARSNRTDKFFGELASQYSIEPVSRANYGQVPPIRMHGGQPLLEKEAFSLQPGDMSGVIAVGDKYVIIRCLGRTKPVIEDMNVVRLELEQDIQEKKIRLAMAKQFDDIKEKAQIDNFLEGTVQTAQAPSEPQS